MVIASIWVKEQLKLLRQSLLDLMAAPVDADGCSARLAKSERKCSFTMTVLSLDGW